MLLIQQDHDEMLTVHIRQIGLQETADRTGIADTILVAGNGAFAYQCNAVHRDPHRFLCHEMCPTSLSMSKKIPPRSSNTPRGYNKRNCICIVKVRPDTSRGYGFSPLLLLW